MAEDPGHPTSSVRLDADDVFLLGAGFSAAATRGVVPTVKHLAPEVLRFLQEAELDRDANGAAAMLMGTDPDLEAFLDYLVGGQPFLPGARDLRLRSVFGEIANWLREYVADRQQAAQREDPEPWLPELVARWHEARVTVITLNYDTLVESTVNGLSLLDGKMMIEPEETLACPVRFASPRPDGQLLPHGERRTFDLYKLHGSLSWYYPGSPGPGQPILDIGFYPWWATSLVVDPGRLRRTVPGMTAFIAPPTLVKSPYFDHELIRTLWVGAASALAAAKRVFVLGYSLPPGDTTMSLLISTSLPASAEVVVADTDADVATRFQEITGVCTLVRGTDPITKLTASIG